MNVKNHQKIVKFALLVLFVGLSGILYAQTNNQGAYGIVIYAEGYEMSIYRDGSYNAYDVLLDDIIGLPLFEGDLVQTDDSTFVEIQLMPTETVLKVAENTTFEIKQLTDNGGADFDITYGRIRAKVEKLTGNDPFEIRSQSAVAGVRGTDFGYDYIASASAEESVAITQVYCFEGQVAVAAQQSKPADASQEAAAGDTVGDSVTPAEDAAAEEPEYVLISANEMVEIEEIVFVDESVESATGAAQLPEPIVEIAINKKVVEEEINQYWSDNTFQVEAMDPETVNEIFPELNQKLGNKKAALVVEKIETPIEPQEGVAKQSLKVKQEQLDQVKQQEMLAQAPKPEPEISEEEMEPEPNFAMQALFGDSERKITTGSVFLVTGVLAATAGILMWTGPDLVGSQWPYDNNPTAGVPTTIVGGIAITTGLVSLIAGLLEAE